MTRSGGEPGDLGRTLDLLGPLLMAEGLEAAAAETVRLIATLSGAEVVALFLASGKDTGAEFWVPADEETRLRFRPHLRGLALESLAQSATVETPFPPQISSGLTPAVIALADQGHTIAIVGLAGAPGACAACRGMAPIVARQLARHQDAAQSQAAKLRYERWFKQFDQQVRTLERERQKLAALVNQPDHYVFSVDRTRAVRWASRAMATRFPPAGGASWIGRDCDEVWPRLGQPAGPAMAAGGPVACALETGRPARQELLRGGGGSTCPVCVTAIPIRDSDGSIQEVLVIAQDLGGLESVRRMERSLEAVVSNAPVVLFSIDADGIFRLSEGRGLAVLGLQPGEVVGRSAFDLYRDNARIVADLRRALAGEAVTTVEEVGDLAFETRYTPQRNPAGDVVGVVGVATDITERRRLEAQLRDSQLSEALGRLAGSVANDFGDLLAVVMGNAGLMLGRLQKEHPLRHPAEEVQRAGARGAQLVRQLLTLSRREEATPRALDPDAVLAGMEGLLRRLAGGEVELGITPGRSPVLVRADQAQLEQALANLVAKACDALPRGGRITLERGTIESGAAGGPLPPGGIVTITMRVTGPVLGERELARSFEALLASGGAQDPGLGLPFARDIVRRFGGDMIGSADTTTGVTITIRLPRHDEAGAPPLREAA